MTRRTTGAIAALLVAGLLAFDMAASDAPDIYAQPALIALGSGSSAGGAHCAALPTE